MDFSGSDRGLYAFDGFLLDPVGRCLLRDRTRVALPPRLFDTLLYLVEHPGRIVDKDEMLTAIWGARFVEEANLSQTVFSLRKTLRANGGGAECIATAPGRGYRFTATVERESWRDGGLAIPAVAPADLSSSDLSDHQPPPKQRRDTAIAAGVAAVGMALAAAVAAWQVRPVERTAQTIGLPAFNPPAHSVAVLPFVNMSGDPGQEYFSDGISEELIGALSRVDGLRVTARTSAFSFKGKSNTIGEIARSLNVGAVLEGSVRRSGTRIRITTELVDGLTGFAQWSASYDRDLNDMLSLQQDIGEAVSRKLEVRLQASDAEKLTLGGTKNPNALDAYLRGKRLEAGLDNAHTRAAIAAFDEAISLDEAFAQARASRASALETRYMQEEAPLLLPEALAEAERAIACAPTLAAAHAIRGAILMYMLKFAAAKAELARALELSPGDGKIAARVAAIAFQMSAGDDADAQIADLIRGVRLNPLAPEAYFYLALALAYYHRSDDALTAIRHEQELEPSNTTISNQLLGLIEITKGNAEIARKVCSAGRDFMEHYCLARAYHALNMPKEALQEMNKVRDQVGDRAASAYADAYSNWGQVSEAVRWLKIAYQQNPGDLVSMRLDSDLDPIHETPEYKEILGKMNFTQ